MTYKYKIKYKDIEYSIRKSVRNKETFYKTCGNVINTITGYNIDKNFSAEIIKKSGILKYIQENKNDIFLTHTNFTLSSSLKHLGIDKVEIWNEVRNIIIRNYPEYQKYLDGRLKYIKNIKYCNLYIMKKELFLEYSNWLFNILFDLEKTINEKNMKNLCMELTMTAGTRFYGCLAERLLNLGVFYQKINKKICF